jgi:hypothetical protein
MIGPTEKETADEVLLKQYAETGYDLAFYFKELDRIISECDKLVATAKNNVPELKRIQHLKALAARCAGKLDLPKPQKLSLKNISNMLSFASILTQLQNNPFKK